MNNSRMTARLEAAERQVAGTDGQRFDILLGRIEESDEAWEARLAARREKEGDGVRVIAVRFVRPVGPVAGNA